jgi:hypothetical protein
MPLSLAFSSSTLWSNAGSITGVSLVSRYCNKAPDGARLKIIILDAFDRQTSERHDRRAGTSWALKFEILVLEDRQCVELYS